MGKRENASGSVSRIGQRRKAARTEPRKRYLERRQEMLGAAAAMFQAKGFQGVRMEDVAKELDVDRATLYYYFGNKEQLFREVIIDAVTANVSAAKEIRQSEASAPDKLETLLTALLESYERSYPLLFVYVQEDMNKIANDSSPESKRLRRLEREYEMTVRAIIEQGVEEGAFAPDTQPTLVAYAIIGAANWSHRWFRPSGKFSGREVGESFSSLVLDGLLVGPARRRTRNRVS